MKQSRFKEIIREELALSRVRLCEAAEPSKHSNVITVLRQALDHLTSAAHEVGDAASRLRNFDPSNAAAIDDYYNDILKQVKLVGAAYRAARQRLPEVNSGEAGAAIRVGEA